MNTAYTIKQAMDADVALLQQVLADNAQSRNISVTSPNLYLYAESNGAVIGLTGVELCHKKALIRSTGVLHKYRCNGIASALFQELVQYLRKLGIEQLYLFSKDTGAFWQRHGFKACEIAEVIAELPETPQVKVYMEDGSIWNDIAWQRKINEMASHYELSDDEFEQQFSATTLSPVLFTHEAHVRLAWLHIKKYGAGAAIKNITAQLKRYVKALGADDKYNETLTVAAVKMVNHFYIQSHRMDFRNFIKENKRLVANFRELIQSHYSFNIFTANEAKQRYIEPDLLPFE